MPELYYIPELLEKGMGFQSPARMNWWDVVRLRIALMLKRRTMLYRKNGMTLLISPVVLDTLRKIAREKSA